VLAGALAGGLARSSPVRAVGGLPRGGYRADGAVRASDFRELRLV